MSQQAIRITIDVLGFDKLVRGQVLELGPNVSIVLQDLGHEVMRGIIDKAAYDLQKELFEAWMNERDDRDSSRPRR